MPFGEVYLSLFLLLFLVAILTSSFSMLEIITAAFTAKKQRSRKKVAWLAGFIVFIAGIPAALSSNTLENFKILQLTVFDASELRVSNIMLPGGCVMIALFIGFRMNRTLLKQEFMNGNHLSAGTYQIWFNVMRWIVPIVIVIVFLGSLGII